MATSPEQFIREQLRAALATEATFAVRSVFKDESANDKTLVYPYVQSLTRGDAMENNSRVGMMTAPCIILANAKTTADPNGTGVASEASGVIALRVMKAFEDYDCESIAVNNDGTYKTRLLSMVYIGGDGDFDIADTKVSKMFQIEVTVYVERI